MENHNGLFGKYEVGRLLGCGAFAKVYYARNLKNGQSVAIKMINKKKIAGTTLMSNIKREITIMRRLRHPNIVRLYEVLASKSKIYFVMEYVKGGELFAKVAKGRFSEDLARKYFRQLISAVGYCHSRGVFHRDLKPENLLVDDNGDLKVSDFGLSAFKDLTPSPAAGAAGGDTAAAPLLQTLCGTPAYVAPEILTKKGYHGSHVDVWSCGVVLYVLTAGYLPFNDPNLMAMYKKIYKGEFKCPKWMSSDLKRFLARLLDTNPNTRITIHQITQDPWFIKGAPNSSSSSTYSFSFYDDYYYDDEDDIKEQQEQDHQHSSLETGSPSLQLNAFDLISFSSGLDLSGLFDQSFNPIVDGDKFVSPETPSKIIDTIEEVSKAANLSIKCKRKKDCVVDLEGHGPNGHFVAKVDIRPLTDQLVVVEVKRRAGDSASFNHIWTNKLRPELSSLVYHMESESDSYSHPAAAAAPPTGPSAQPAAGVDS